MSKGGPNQDNHANQLNPNNDVYWESRGWDSRPDDWEERNEEEQSKKDETLPNDPKASSSK